MAELMYKIANEEAPDVRIVRPELPEALARVVARALSKRPEIRYQDGGQFAADLRNALESVAGAVRAAAPTPQAGANSDGGKTVAFSATVPASSRDFENTVAQSPSDRNHTPN
jgi:serine/threonine-protein kinase